MRLLAAILVLALSFAAAYAADGDTDALVDFLTLAIAPEGEDGQTLIEVGKANAEQSRLDEVIQKLPRGFLGIDLLAAKRSLDGAAALALCREACRANETCRDVAYIPPTDDRAVGLCTLKRARIAENFGRMSPVTDEASATTPATEAPPIPDATETADAAEEEIAPPDLPAITPVELRLPPRKRNVEESIPPPPDLPPIEVVAIGLPPRSVVTAPPRDITKPPPHFAEAKPPVVAAPAEPPARKRGLPLWLALGAIAVMIGGAMVYRRNYNARQRARLTTRLVSNGLDRQTVTIDGGEPAFSLKVVRVAANTNARIELIRKGTPA